MTADLALRPILAEDRPVVERLWQLYRHDLSEFRGQHDPSGFRETLPMEDGTFNARGLLPYVQENADRAAYLFQIGARPVGFASICGLVLNHDMWPSSSSCGVLAGRASGARPCRSCSPCIQERGRFRFRSTTLRQLASGEESRPALGAMRLARNVGLFPASRKCRRMSGSRSTSTSGDIRERWRRRVVARGSRRME